VSINDVIATILNRNIGVLTRRLENHLLDRQLSIIF